MSNAMRMGKRTLAGVAAGALTLGVLSIAGATSSSAAPSIKPKVTTSTTAASIGPVRYSTTASTQDPVLGAPILFSAVGTDDSKVTADDTIVVTLLVAPSNSSTMWLKKSQSTFPSGATGSQGIFTLASPKGGADDSVLSGLFTVQNATSTDDTVLSTHVAVNEGGSYSGNIKIYNGAQAGQNTSNLIQTTTFSFTTAGKPASLTLDPTSAALVASTLSTQDVTGTVKDSTGAITQIGATDSFAVASASTTVATVSTALLDATNFDDSTATVLGTGEFTITATATAGSTSVTATPLGTLPGNGVTAQSVAVTTSATGPTAPTKLSVTSPTTQIIDDTVLDDTLGYDVNRALVTSLTITGTGATASAGQTVLVSASNSSWTGLKVAGTAIANNTSGNSVLVTADASGNLTLGVSWTSVANGGKLTVQTGTGSKAKWVVVDVVDASADSSSSPAGAIIQKTGTATDFAVTLTDDFGNAYAGYRVTGKAVANAGSPSGSSSAVGTTDASGKATISVPAPSATFTGAATVTFTVLTPGGSSTSGLAPSTVAVTYSASGDVTSLSVAQAQTNSGTFTNATTALTSYPTILVPYGGTAATSAGTPGTYTVSTATGTAAGNVAVFAATATPANSVTVTVPTGVKVSKTDNVLWSGGSQSVTVASGASVYVFSTKVGTHDITFTSGTITATGKVKVSTTAAAAYNIAVTPPTQELATGAIGSATLKVTDVFGNAVGGTSKDDTGGVTVTATGEILLGGFNNTVNLGTDTNGEARIVIIAGNAPGTGSLALTPATKSNAWAAAYVPPTGAPAPVTSAAATVTVTSSAVKSITITGSRTTVSGKPGIMIDGITTGIEDGKTVIPYFRFPGETSYTEGSARPEINDGEFTWQRKTGKKFYAYVTNDDGAVQSNRVIIAAN